MPPTTIPTDGQKAEQPHVQAAGQHHPHHHPHRLFKVYVTGFGPFEKIPTNASSHVASHLPSVLDEKYISHAPAAVKAANLQVSIIPHFEPVPVSYDKVTKLIPTLYQDLPGVDLFVHIGVAPFEHYQIETRARRRPYGPPDDNPDGRRDVDGRWPDGHSAEGAAGGKVPDEVTEIVSSLDVKGICDVLAKVKQEHDEKGADESWYPPQASDDAGLYLCEFILYNSMAEAVYDATYESEYPESQPVSDPTSTPPSTSRAVFIHIPSKIEEEWLERSLETVKRIIGAIAVQRASRWID
ncbi:hypothetical protein TWF696_004152 [Orbilia brochopaga]|uniref:Pyroglutamyl-peptidase I n=1 Tax=Orbilia brochopaga TaxID=3140254 RepID=A0AAV9V5A7_9PEZI